MSSPDQNCIHLNQNSKKQLFLNFLTCSDKGSDYDSLVLLMYDHGK